MLGAWRKLSMKGEYKVTLTTKNNVIRYTVSISRQITIVCGKSGIGKTLLHDMAAEYCKTGGKGAVEISSGDDNVSIEPFDSSIALLKEVKNGKKFRDGTIRLTWLEKPSKKIFIIDEDLIITKGINFADAIRYTDAYYIIFTRDLRLYKYLYNSVWDIITLEDVGVVGIDNRAVRMYNEFNGYIKGYSEVIHEDSTTGREICELALCEKIKTSYGNLNLVSHIKKNYKNTSILVVADGASFSNIMERLKKVSKRKQLSIYLILPESTEYVLLHNATFSESGNVSEYLLDPVSKYNTENWITYEKMYEQVIIEESSKIDEVGNYEKVEGLETYKTESFIDTYRAILNKIDGIKSSYNVKYSLYKIVDGEMVTCECKGSAISNLNRSNEL